MCCSRQVVQMALEGVDPLKVDDAQLAKLLEEVGKAATLKATEVGAVAGREEALTINLVKFLVNFQAASHLAILDKVNL